MERLTQFLEQQLVPLLKPSVDVFHAVIDPLPPSVWRFSICAYLVLGTIWALFLSRDYVLLESRPRTLAGLEAVGSSFARALPVDLPVRLTP